MVLTPALLSCVSPPPRLWGALGVSHIALPFVRQKSVPPRSHRQVWGSIGWSGKEEARRLEAGLPQNEPDGRDSGVYVSAHQRELTV